MYTYEEKLEMAFKSIMSFVIVFFCFFLPIKVMFQTKSITNYAKQKIYQVETRAKIQQEQYQDKIQELNKQIESLRKIAGPKIAYQENLKCLTDNVYYEAGLEPEEGMKAVAQVTLNRLHDPSRPKTVCGVVYEYKQFSWTEHAPKQKNPYLYTTALQIAKNMLTKKDTSGIIGSDVMYFHATYVHPAWAEGREPVAEIGKHIFYK